MPGPSLLGNNYDKKYPSCIQFLKCMSILLLGVIVDDRMLRIIFVADVRSFNGYSYCY